MEIDEMQTNTEVYAFDKFGRMCYHPDFHFNHRKPYSEEDLEYICKFWDYDQARSLGFAVGKTEHTIRSTINQLKKITPFEEYKNKFEYYKNRNKYW